MKGLKKLLQPVLYAYPRWFWEFLIFSFLGWIVETVYVFMVTGEWTIRGCLAYGLPIIHIYGFGGLIIVHFIGRLRDHPFLYFFASMLVLTGVELIGSYIEQYIFGERTWDYSDKPFNFEGRVCLSTSLGWGALGFLVEYVIYPEITKFLNKMRRSFMVYSSLFLTIYVIIVSILRYTPGLM